MRGKEKCKALKEIRKQIAENNDIEYAVSECTHQGDCKGTCPKCEAELRYLERELEKRTRMGKKAVIAGISALAAIGFTGCNDKEPQMTGDVPNTEVQELDGETEYYTEETTEDVIMGEPMIEEEIVISTQEGSIEK